MRYFREVWNEERREFDRTEIDRREARRLLYGNYKDVDLCLDTEGYYRLYAGGVEVAKEDMSNVTLKAVLESATTADILRVLIPLIHERGNEVAVYPLSSDEPIIYDTRTFFGADSAEHFEQAINEIAERLNSIDIWIDRRSN